MRVTSELFVAALVRRCRSANAPAYVVSRGAREAGAVFVSVDRLDGRVDLYGPAPQAMFDEEDNKRRFERLIDQGTEAEVDERLARERSFDPDLWIVAIEDRDGRGFVDLA